MDRHGISADGEPELKNGEGFQFEKQKTKFAGIARKKGKLGNLQAKSLVQHREISMTDSDEEEQEEQCNNVMVFVEPKRAPVNYLTMSAKLSSMTRFDHADVKEAAYKMTEVRGIDDQDNESVEDNQMDSDSTMLQAPICSSPGCASVQH
jgi:hypothetical protein